MVRKVKPITPAEAAKLKVTVFPTQVIEAFNYLITKNFIRDSASIKFKDAKEEIIKRLPDVDFDGEWLNIEGIYRASGWTVSTYSPDWGETYDSYYTFKAPK